MEKKYNKQLIFDYIYGYDIKDYDIEELEDSFEFMKAVIDCTNDEKMFYYCSEKLKLNYNFIKYLINKFRMNEQFVLSIVDNYLNSQKEKDNNYDELIVIMDQISRENKYEDASIFKIKANLFFELKMVELVTFLDSLEDKEWKKELGLGFLVITEEYKDNKIIIDYFAKKFITKIFYEEENYFLEDNIHRTFNSYQELEKYGKNNYLIEYVKKYDSYLSWYLSCHIELLENIKKELTKIKENWNNYLLINSNRKVNAFLQELENYIEENNFVSKVSIVNIINYICNKFNLYEEFNTCSNILYFFDEEENNYIDNEISNKVNFDELLCIKFANKLACKLFKEKLIEQNDEEQSKLKNKTNILKVNFKIK